MLLAIAQRRFGGEMPENVTRIEFQLRRDALRNMCILGHKDGIVTPEDWFKYRDAIVNYLCQNWLVITDKDFDRTHSERLTENDYHPHWKEAVFAFKRNTVQLSISNYLALGYDIGKGGTYLRITHTAELCKYKYK
jgi:hypothetical protein